jgi:hypothetical protein
VLVKVKPKKGSINNWKILGMGAAFVQAAGPNNFRRKSYGRFAAARFLKVKSGGRGARPTRLLCDCLYSVAGFEAGA